MGTMTVQEAVRHAVERGELAPLFDHFTDDVEVAVTLNLPASAHRTCRGRQSAIVSLGASDDARRPPRAAQDVFGNDERIVALLDQGLATGPGLAVRSECVLVLDLRDGAIARLAIHHELFPVLPAVPAAVAGEAPRDPPHDDLPVPAEA
ncbi:MAG TPA: hypothetical protein VFX05_01135 [Casimicrobiaceae bacterium]|nr:hypothetical protein [Casimicrobiaceae bacterium]